MGSEIYILYGVGNAYILYGVGNVTFTTQLVMLIKKDILYGDPETLLSTCYIVCDKSNTVRLTGINIYILKTQLM